MSDWVRGKYDLPVNIRGQVNSDRHKEMTTTNATTAKSILRMPVHRKAVRVAIRMELRICNMRR